MIGIGRDISSIPSIYIKFQKAYVCLKNEVLVTRIGENN